MKKPFLLLFITTLLMAGCGPSGQQQEATEETAPEKVYDDLTQAPDGNAKVVFSNEYVRVLMINLKPGEQQPLHRGGNRTIYALSDYTLDWTEDDGAPETKQWQAGEVHWHAAGVHRAKNTGDADASYLVVERTDEPLPECELSNLEDDISKVFPDHTRSLFENDYVRVSQVTLAPGEKTPEHNGINRVVYALTDYTLAYTSDTDESSEKIFIPGDTHWHNACRHSVTNIGDSQAQFLVFALKQ